MHIAVVVFPGSNRYRDIYNCFSVYKKCKIEFLPHDTGELKNYDLIVLCGGFSYGDELGAGLTASRQPILRAIKDADQVNIPILGICNGFQILTQAKLLAGSLLPNQKGCFISDSVKILVKNNKNIFTKFYSENEVINLPVAHQEGRYCIDPEGLKILKQKNQIIMQYADHNINGSVCNIAAISNEKGNILGMMPHPENNFFMYQGSGDGKKLFASICHKFGIN